MTMPIYSIINLERYTIPNCQNNDMKRVPKIISNIENSKYYGFASNFYTVKMAIRQETHQISKILLPTIYYLFVYVIVKNTNCFGHMFDFITMTILLKVVKTEDVYTST